MEKYLSNRGQITAEHHDFMGHYMNACIENPYSEDDNSGYVNLGTAENRLCDDMLLEKLNSPGYSKVEPWMLHYYTYRGNLSFRKTVGKFIDRYFHSQKPVDPEHISMLLGTCTAFDVVAHAVSDPGDVFLSPSPYYTRVQNDLHERALVDTYSIPLTSELEEGETKPFQLTVARVKRAYEQAIAEGQNVRGIVIINPNNPLGTIYSPQELIPIMEFMKSKGLWVIMDEIYALSVYDEHAKFRSVFNWMDRVPDPQRTIWFWGLSKDFAMPGLRISFIHTPNQYLSKCVKQLSIFHTVPAPLHTPVQKLLSDYEWLDSVYFPENLSRMRENYQLLRETFSALGIPILNSQGGLYAFADFRMYMSSQDFEGELELFEKFFEAGVYFLPGKELFCEEPGWFRIVFTVARPTLLEGLRRIETVLKERKLSR
jgi:aspartate/methionine/tyrosine aminotransferase